MTVDITPTEIAGQFWVCTNMDGYEMRRHGPYPNVGAAEDMAARLAAVCRTLHSEVNLQAAGNR